VADIECVLVLGFPVPEVPVTPSRVFDRTCVLVLGTAEAPEHDYLTLNGQNITVGGDPIWVS